MGFLRKNIFLVSVIGAVVVLGGAMLLMDLGASGKVDSLAAVRRDLSEELANLIGGPKVSPGVLKAERDRVQDIKDAARKVLDQSVAFNRRNFRVLELPMVDESGQVLEKVPAFPIDREKYQRHGLRFVMAQQYRRELAAMLDELKATRVPTAQETAEEEGRVRQKLAFRKTADEKKKGEALLGPVITPARQRELEMPMGGKYGPMGPMPGAGLSGKFGGPAADSSDISAEVREKALQSIRIKKACVGQVYATMDSFDMVFTGEEVSAADTRLWQAQLALWAMGDIVAAIRDTNTQALEPLPEDQRNVLKAPVKRLVKIDVDRNYYMGQQAGQQPAAGGASPAPGGPAFGKFGPMGPGGKFGPMEPMEGPAQPSMQPGSGGLTGGALTQRTCNQLYDVLHYRFTVIMPTRCIPLLQQNLLRRNNHTILSMGIEIVGSGAASGRYSAQLGAESLYYYGTDPVSTVTIAGELLFMTPWERGTWDEKTGAWSQELPPLMPVEVLQELDRNAGVLREDDRRRLTG